MEAFHLDNEVLRKYYKSKNFENRGPIVKQTFDHGDMCHEVGHRREMTVEMRCCTEDEVSSFLPVVKISLLIPSTEYYSLLHSCCDG